jgi:hypothetical protein
MSVPTFPSTPCKLSHTNKHEWENVIDYSKPAVQVMPMIWGTYRKIVCKFCGKHRDTKEENGVLIWEE